MSPIYTSFYTVGTAYEHEARELLLSLHAFDLFSHVEGVRNLGDWCANCSQKPAYIRSIMRRYPRMPVVWLDADARVMQQPFMFNGLHCDMACHYLTGQELLSGTLYFDGGDASIALVDQWAKECGMNPGVWDQKILQWIVERNPQYRVEALPESYAAIFDRRNWDGNAVILHTQASRRLKHAV